MSKENDIWLPEIDINSHYLETTSYDKINNNAD